MNKERELLIQAIDACDACDDEKDAYYERLNNVFEEIRNYLICEPERKPMTEEEIERRIDVNNFSHEAASAFASGIRSAEKHHGIGESL